MNSVVHFEMPYKKEKRAKEFYKGVFKWDIKPVPDMDANMISTTETDKNGNSMTKGAINGTMHSRNTMGENPVIVIRVDDLDSYIEKVKMKGGKIVMPKMEMGNMGYYARVKDTEDNIIGIWQNM